MSWWCGICGWFCRSSSSWRHSRGRSDRCRSQRICGRQWTSERFRNVLKRESRIGLQGQGLSIQAYREIAIAISRRFMRPGVRFQTDHTDAKDQQEKKEEEEEDHEESSIADIQAGHTTHIAGMIYARGIMEQPGVVAEKRQQFRTSSMEWHRFIGFESATGDHKARGHETGFGQNKRKRAPFEVEAEEGRRKRQRRR